MPPRSSIPYDLILFGATGYTGKLTAEHITTHLPTDLRWAVAGRSESKLFSIVNELKTLNPDRLAPRVEVAGVVPAELDALVKKTKVLVNTVGPYHLYSTPVVEACAKNGTHYLDVTGESPWVLDMIRKYDETAKASGAIIIPEIGIESSPSDLLTWALVTTIRTQCQISTKEVITSVHELNSLPSGGTWATILSIFSAYSLQEIASASSGNWSSSITAGPNVAVVQRSWGLHNAGTLYGPNFQYQEYMAVRNRLVGAGLHLALTLGTLALLLPPVRWLLRKVIFAPGQGASKAVTAKDSLEFRAVATADEREGMTGTPPRRAFGRFRYEGGVYHLTGVFLAEAAMVLLEDEGLVKRLGGGLFTPAMLGKGFVDRMVRAGVVLETCMLSE